MADIASSSTNKKAKIEENEHDPESDWQELYVNSKDRVVASQNTSDFCVQIKDWRNWVDVVYLDQVHVPPLYNIDTNNNIITFNEGGGDLIATLEPGAYSLNTGATLLQQAIKTALENAPGSAGVYTVTYNDNTYKLTILSTVPYQIDFSQNSQLAAVLGYSPVATTLGITSTSDLVVDLSIDDLFLVIPQFTTNGRNNVQNTLHYTFRLPLKEETFGNKQSLFRTNELTYQSRIFDNSVPLNRLDVKVVDKYGQHKDFQGAEWSFILKYRNTTQRN